MSLGRRDNDEDPWSTLPHELGRADLYGEANAIGSVIDEATAGSFRDAGTLAIASSDHDDPLPRSIARRAQGGQKMWKPLIWKESGSAASKLQIAQLRGTLALRAKEASIVGRTGIPASVLVVAAAVFSLAALAFSASAASSQNRSLRATKAFHGTKDCSGSTGLAGSFCTFRSSNVKAVKVGSRIFYFQPAGKTELNSDAAIYVRRGTVATGHCRLIFATGVGLCTISDGTGALAGFYARVRVTPDSSVPKLWHWDGTYGFKRR